MGLGSMVAGAAVDAAAKQKEMNQRLKGRTPDQQKVIKYFYGSGGCLKKGLTNDEYESMVMAKAKSMDFKQKALDKIGLDESQVREVEPVHFEGWWWGDTEKDANKFYTLRGKDGVWRTSAYQITWIFFSATQVYVYKYTFNMDEDGKNEQTEEYFYKDITNFSTSSETVERETPIKTSCTGNVTYLRTKVDINRFTLSAMGDKFFCAMQQNDYTEKAVQGMKVKLREKKG
jgi:hypothetical protein